MQDRAFDIQYKRYLVLLSDVEVYGVGVSVASINLPGPSSRTLRFDRMGMFVRFNQWCPFGGYVRKKPKNVQKPRI